MLSLIWKLWLRSTSEQHPFVKACRPSFKISWFELMLWMFILFTVSTTCCINCYKKNCTPLASYCYIRASYLSKKKRQHLISLSWSYTNFIELLEPWWGRELKTFTLEHVDVAFRMFSKWPRVLRPFLNASNLAFIYNLYLCRKH